MSEVTQIAPVVTMEPTSAKLSELKSSRSAISAKLKQAEPDSVEFNNLLDELQTNKKEQIAEVANIKKAEADEKLSLLRSERTGTIEVFEAAVLAAAAKGAGDAEKAAKQAARDVLVNLVLPNHATKTATATKTEGAKKGGTSEAIYNELKTRIDAGLSPSDAVKEVMLLTDTNGKQYSRGTVGTVRTQYWPVVK